MNPSIETLSTPLEDLALEDLQYHPLIRARIEETLKTWLAHFRTVPPGDLMKTQGRVEILELMLKLPQKVYEEEKGKK